MPKNTFIPKGISELDKHLKMANPINLPTSILNNKALQQVAQKNGIEALLGEIEKYNKFISSKSSAINNIEKTEKIAKLYTFDEALKKTRSEYDFIIKALEDN